jgi:hypothetical protein
MLLKPYQIYGNTRREEAISLPKARITSSSGRKIRPALSPEARENQMISLAVDLAEKQLIEGTASSQVITHFLKLGSTKAQIEKELLSKQVDLAEAKAESIKSQKDMEKVYLDAMAAMREYRGESEADDDED